MPFFCAELLHRNGRWTLVLLEKLTLFADKYHLIFYSVCVAVFVVLYCVCTLEDMIRNNENRSNNLIEFLLVAVRSDRYLSACI
jgi:hypothetical protein